MPSIVCPTPVGINYDEARAMFNQVRKENPKLTPATIRREAARRMQTDYDTYLNAWKKPTTTPVTPPPVVIPDPPIKLPDLPTPVPEPAPAVPTLNYDTARAQYKSILKENKGLTPAQARREAARRMNVDYDTYLKHWKGDAKAPAPTPSPSPTTVAPAVRKPVEQGIKLDKASLTRYLKSKGHKISTKSKERFTHSGASYGGGISDSAGISIQASANGDSVVVRIRPGFRTPEAVTAQRVQITRELRDAGFDVDVFNNLTLTVSKKRAYTTFSDDAPPWRLKEGAPDPDKFTSDGDFFLVDGVDAAKIVFERGFYRIRPTNLKNPYKLNPNQIFRERSAAFDAAEKQVADGVSDIGAVNPGHRVVNGTTQNCPSTTSAYELRRRGYDVVARTMPNGQQLADIYRAWGVSIKDQIIDVASFERRFGKIEERHTDWAYPVEIDKHDWVRLAHRGPTEQLPVGARGFMSNQWERGGGGHIWNWEMREDGMWYIDAQSGEEWRAADDRYIGRSSQIYAARTDLLEINPDLVGWMVSDQGQIPISGAPRWASNVNSDQKDLSLS